MIAKAVLIAVLLASSGIAPPARGDEGPVTPHNDDSWLVNIESWEPGDSGGTPGDNGSTAHHTKTTPKRASCVVTPMPSCVPVLVCQPDSSSPSGGVFVVYGPLIVGEPYLGPCTPVTTPPAITPGAVLSALRRVQLPASRLVIQPPGGKTLVNFDTIFSTRAVQFERTVRLLGEEVRLKIWPSSFTWIHGDETSQITDEAGRTYQQGLPMDSYITHQYTDAQVTVHPRVHTTYSAEFSLDGGATWQDVDGTVTIEGATADLRVVEARPVLVGGY